jgi:RNA-binding protein YhbY
MSEENNKSGSERRLLKSSAKVREVDVKIGKKGLTQNVILEIRLVLKRDKMVKVSFRDEREKRVKLVEGIQEKIESTLVEFVGKTATFAL